MLIEHFQMIDRIETVEDEPARLVAQAAVPGASTVFEGHFPGHPLMPGVLLIETMAQAAGFLVLARNGFSRMPFLAGVKDAKLRTFVEPETALRIEALIDHEGSGFVVADAAISAADARICDARLTFRLTDFPVAELAGHMRDRARAIGLSP